MARNKKKGIALDQVRAHAVHWPCAPAKLLDMLFWQMGDISSCSPAVVRKAAKQVGAPHQAEKTHDSRASPHRTAAVRGGANSEPISESRGAVAVAVSSPLHGFFERKNIFVTDVDLCLFHVSFYECVHDVCLYICVVVSGGLHVFSHAQCWQESVLICSDIYFYFIFVNKIVNKICRFYVSMHCVKTCIDTHACMHAFMHVYIYAIWFLVFLRIHAYIHAYL